MRTPVREDRVNLDLHVLDFVLQTKVDVFTQRLHTGHLQVGNVFSEFGSALHQFQAVFLVLSVNTSVDHLQVLCGDVLIDNVLVVNVLTHGLQLVVVYFLLEPART